MRFAEHFITFLNEIIIVKIYFGLLKIQVRFLMN